MAMFSPQVHQVLGRIWSLREEAMCTNVLFRIHSE